MNTEASAAAQPTASLTSVISRRAVLGTTTTALAAALAGAGKTTAAEDPVPTAGPRPTLTTAREAVKTIEDVITRISREVWEKPAVGLEEHEAMKIHIRELERAGFRITHREAGGHPTAFVAEWSLGSGGPKIGFLPEYDALPGLGNAAEPLPKPAENGDTDGHGCGHNCLGAGCTGAAIALKSMMERSKTPGTLVVFGCGAEETEPAKVYMAKAGFFNDLTAALAWHPTPVAVSGTVFTAANRKIYINWKGRTAHAGSNPWDGRSALDAAELFTHGLNMMREHLRPTARLHYIYEVAGVAPNIVPDEARVWMTARDANNELVDATVEWCRQLADGAALGTQTKADFHVPIGMVEMVPNETLMRRVHEHMRHVPLDWTAEEHAFAKSCQKAMGLPELGMATEVMPFIKDFVVGGSSDVADVSWNTPASFFGWPTHPIGVSAHTWAVTACGGTSIGDKGSIGAAALLAALGMDLLTDKAFRAAVRAEFEKRVAGKKYQATLDPDPDMVGQSAKRFIKGPGEEGISGIDGPAR